MKKYLWLLPVGLATVGVTMVGLAGLFALVGAPLQDVKALAFIGGSSAAVGVALEGALK